MSEQNNTPEPVKSSPARFIRPIILLVVLSIAAWYAYGAWQYSKHHITTDNAQVETHSAPVLARVAGYVTDVKVADYTEVKKGQLLIAIDSAESYAALAVLEADLKQAEADLVAVQANVKNTQVAVGTSDATIALNQTRVDKALRDYQRDQNLFKDNAITAKQLDDSKAAYETALQQVKVNQDDKMTANSRVDVARSNIAKAEAAIAYRKARIQEQRLKLQYTKLYAPIDGRIGKKSVEVGQYVQPGQNLFTIINDADYWVTANFKETQLEDLHEGMEVELKLDAYPNITLKGKIIDFSGATGSKFSLLPPDNASGNFVKVTQRVPVKIQILDVDQHRDILRAGMSVEVAIKI